MVFLLLSGKSSGLMFLLFRNRSLGSHPCGHFFVWKTLMAEQCEMPGLIGRCISDQYLIRVSCCFVTLGTFSSTGATGHGCG